MPYLNNDNSDQFLNTNTEATAVCLTSDCEELNLGVGPCAYLRRVDAKHLLSDDEFDTACGHPLNLNPLFVHLDEATLFQLLHRDDFFISTPPRNN